MRKPAGSSGETEKSSFERGEKRQESAEGIFHHVGQQSAQHGCKDGNDGVRGSICFPVTKTMKLAVWWSALVYCSVILLSQIDWPDSRPRRTRLHRRVPCRDKTMYSNATKTGIPIAEKMNGRSLLYASACCTQVISSGSPWRLAVELCAVTSGSKVQDHVTTNMKSSPSGKHHHRTQID
eukprot:1161133-Rhodomonas_salina.1